VSELPAIRVESLTVKYGETIALEGVDLEVSAGKVCGIVGINGSGKSTLFKAIMGAIKASTGSVEVVGASPASARASGTIGYVPQSEQVDGGFPLSVRDVVMMGRYGRMTSRRSPAPADDEAVELALTRVGMESLSGRQIGALSGGQRKRVFVARSLAQGAAVMLLDEPLAGVDGVSRSAIAAVLHEVADQGGTALVATHDLRALPDLCDEVVVLRNRVLFRGAVEDALRPENLALAFGLDLMETERGDSWGS
jgi:manganese transport system ATP-binding protein